MCYPLIGGPTHRAPLHASAIGGHYISIDRGPDRSAVWGFLDSHRTLRYVLILERFLGAQE